MKLISIKTSNFECIKQFGVQVLIPYNKFQIKRLKQIRQLKQLLIFIFPYSIYKTNLQQIRQLKLLNTFLFPYNKFYSKVDKLDNKNS